MNIYYVYKYIRKDYGTCFYVGKGKGNRYKTLNSRSRYFLDIVSRVEYDIEFVKTDLTENEAFEIEKQTITDLANNEDYTIQLYGDANHDAPKHLVNRTYGGGPTSYGYKQPKDVIENRVRKNTGKKRNDIQKNNSKQARLEFLENNPDFVKKLRTLRVGIKHTDKTKELIRLRKIGKKPSEEAINKWRKSFYSKSKEELQARRDAVSKKMGQSVRNINFDLEFTSLRRAADYFNKAYGLSINKGGIKKCCDKFYNKDWYGEVDIDGKTIQLKWEYINTPTTTERENANSISDATV